MQHLPVSPTLLPPRASQRLSIYFSRHLQEAPAINLLTAISRTFAEYSRAEKPEFC
ncbi:MAG: hypothetical protein ABRQ39_25965 [Candidatus Eremiobacterota bacterium]